MKKVLWVCSFLLAAALLIAGQTNLLNNGKENTDQPTVQSVGAKANPVVPMTGAAYEAMKDRYYALIDRVNAGEATESEITELREMCFSWELPLPEVLTVPVDEPATPVHDGNPLDQGGVDTVANCASAAVIASLPYSDSGNFDGDNDCSVVSASPYNEVFYTFTPAVSGNYQFRARSYTTGVAAIRVMSGGCCLGATSVAFSASSVATDCGEPATVVTYLRATLTAGTPYWIHVGTSSSTVSTLGYDFSMNYIPCPNPELDGATHATCATAQTIACNDSIFGDSAISTSPDWYAITLSEPESLRVFVGGRELGHCNSGLYPGGTGVDGRFTIYSSCSQTCSDSVGYDNDSGCSFDAKKAFCLTAGTYYIKVWNTSVMEYVMKVDCGPPCTPAPVLIPTNDLCANAITVAAPSATPGTTVCATTDVVPTCGTGYTAGAPSVWYKVIGNGNTLTADVCTSSYDTRLAVYTGTCGNLAGLTCIGGDDDACDTPNGVGSRVIWCSDAGVEYLVYVNAYSATGQGTFTLTITDGQNCHVDCANYPPCGTPAETEPNDSCFWAANFMSLTCGDAGAPAYYFGTVCPQTDVDYYYIPGVTLGQIVRVKLYEGANCDTYPPVGLAMRGATGTGGVCAAATGTATNNYVLGTNCAPFTGGYIAVVRNTGFENKYKIEVSCSTAVLPACPDVQLPKQYCAGPCVGPIVDVSSTSYTQTVGLNEIIDDVNVRINAVHTYDGDVIFRLTSPSGSLITLINRRGGSGDNFQITVLDDEASTPIASGTAPFNGSYIPDTPLSTFDGQNAQGTWTLTVVDTAGGDVGYLNCWCLEFTSHSPCTATPAVNFERYPVPQYSCADLCTGTATLIRICQGGVPFNPSLPPIVTVASGCQTEGCQVACEGAQFAYDPTLWHINPDNGCWENVVTGVTSGCVCVTLEDFLGVELNGGLTAVTGDRSVALTWRTASETNVDHFEVMRDHVKVTEIVASGSPTSGASYTWTDRGLVNGHSYRYTLAVVEVTGERAEVATVEATPTAEVVVTEYALHQNYPNPFNPTTSITFDLVEGGMVSLKVFNVVGQEVAELVNGSLSSGRHAVSFDATGLPSGLYIYRIETNGFVTQHKMLLMK